MSRKKRNFVAFYALRTKISLKEVLWYVICMK